MKSISINPQMKRRLVTMSVTYVATVFSLMAMVVLAMAADDYGPFATLQSTISTLMEQAIAVLQSFIIPIALVSCLVAFIVGRLPGIGMKVQEQSKQVFWASIAIVVVSFALRAIFAIAQSVGESIGAAA